MDHKIEKIERANKLRAIAALIVMELTVAILTVIVLIS